MKKLLVFIVIVVMVMFGFQSSALAVEVEGMNNIQFLNVVPLIPAPTNSYIKVTSYVAVTNGIGGYNYYMYVESYTTNKTRSIWGWVTTNLVTGTWVKGDTSKVKYDWRERLIVGDHYYDRFLCIGSTTNRFFKPSMDTP